jgi:hypothetical protein
VSYRRWPSKEMERVKKKGKRTTRRCVRSHRAIDRRVRSRTREVTVPTLTKRPLWRAPEGTVQ